MTRTSSARSGSVLLIIMIAVAMFAALTYVIIRGSRSGSVQAITDDQARVAATEIIAYGEAVAKAVQTLRLRGCTDAQLDFNNNGISKTTAGTAYNYTNANSPSDGSCSVFGTNGGKVNAQLISKGYVDPALVPAGSMHSQSFFVHSIRVLGVGTDTANAQGSELLFWIGRLDRTVCLKINEILGVENPSGAPPLDTFTPVLVYKGIYQNSTNPLGDTATTLAGKSAFCHAYDASPLNFMYQRVLIAR